MYNKIKEKNLQESKQEKEKGKICFLKIFIAFLVIGMILLWRLNVVQVKIITAIPRVTIAGKGVFIQSCQKCSPRIKVAFNLPETRFISKTGKGYLIKIPKLKNKVEIITLKPKITIMHKNIFVQSLEPCLPRVKLRKKG